MTLPNVETLVSAGRREVWRPDTVRSRDHPMLYWITRGQGRFMVDCRMRGIGPNTVVFVPAHTLYSYEMFAQPQGMVVALPAGSDTGLPSEPALLRTTSVQQQGALGGLIDALARELSQARVGHVRAVQSHLMMLAVQLERLLEDQPQMHLGKSDQVLRKFSHVLSIGHRDGKSVGDFAADLHVTPTHLTRLTQTSVGKPASALVQERIIHAACDALVHSDRSVKDIAGHLGFSSPAYFTRAFQAQTGKSPSNFRKSRRLSGGLQGVATQHA